jgi:multiple sugar transport system permease protein
MVMTSPEEPGELIQNPLDFSIDLSQGWELFRSYEELIAISISAATCGPPSTCRC